MLNRSGSVAVALVLSLLATLACAQQTDSTQTLHVTSRLVLLDAVVTDKLGIPVTGLTRDDFRVFQDGVEQKLASFDPHPPPGKTSEAARTGAPTLLILDELNTPFAEIAYVHDQAARFMVNQPAELAFPMMLLVIDDLGYQSLGPYTRDRDTLLRELTSHKTGLPGKLMRGANDEMIALSLSLLQQIAIASQGQTGHKLLLWIGRGFPGFNPQDLPEERQELVRTLVAKTSNLLTDSRITVSKIDPTPSSTTVTSDFLNDDIGNPESLSASQEPLSSNFNFDTFVRQTGGQFIFGRNDLDRAVEKYIGDENVYYTLGYVPKTSNEEIYRAIRIVMSNPEWRARTRTGLFPVITKQVSPSLKVLGAEIYEAAVSGIPYTGLSVHVASCAGSRENAVCHVKVDLANLRGERSENGDYHIPLVAAFVLLDRRGKIVDYRAERITESIPSHDSRPLNEGAIDVPMKVLTISSNQSARIVIRDALGHIGTTSAQPHMP